MKVLFSLIYRAPYLDLEIPSTEIGKSSNNRLQNCLASKIELLKNKKYKLTSKLL